MARLNYSADREIRDQPGKTMRTLVNDLINAQEASGPVDVDIAQVRPLGSGWLISVSLSAEAPLAQLVDLEDTVAQAAVDVGMEPDVPTAKESITIS
jgi:hypothetical protein